MPRVLFVNEHREIEVTAGRTISEAAQELGIAVCREEFAGTGIGDYTVGSECEPGCVSPPTFYERFMKGCKGWRRMANKARVQGDVKVYTQQGMKMRTFAPRPVDVPPNPLEDPTAPRFDHANNAAGTAWNPYGHPKAVGEGKREAPVYVPKTKKKKAAAKPAAAAEAPAEAAAAAPPDADS